MTGVTSAARLSSAMVPLLFMAAAPVVSADDLTYDEPPKIVKSAKPKYPVVPFQQGVEGTVLIEFTVNVKGGVEALKIIESIPALDQAALDCVKKWRFTPAKRAGRAVAARAQAPVTFYLK